MMFWSQNKVLSSTSLKARKITAGKAWFAFNRHVSCNLFLFLAVIQWFSSSHLIPHAQV